MPREQIRKTYKLFVGGAFPRSESGRSYQVTDSSGRFVANVAQASRKDVRDAVVAARAGFDRWSAATAYNRGQVLYRVAEVMEGRRDQFIGEVSGAEGLTRRQAGALVDESIDRWVWYAGWTDKLAQVHGAANPVAGPFFNFSVPEPTGVVGVVAPQATSLLGLVSVLAPVLATGCSAVVLASETMPVPAVTLSEVMATSDVPAGVANVLTGSARELAPWLAAHADVNALDLTGVDDDVLATELEQAAAETLTRVRRRDPGEDLAAPPGLSRMLGVLEIKTVWHPVGT